MEIISIKNNYEFRRLYSRGKSASASNLVLYCRKNGRQENRLGITVSTKVGKAVVRNRVRRRIREIYRLNGHLLEPGYDIVIVARVRSREATFAQLDRDFLYLSEKLGLLALERRPE